MENVGKFLIQNRKGVKKMKKLLACSLVVLMAAGNAFAATTSPVTVSAAVASSARDIIASPASITWNMPAGTAADHRFISPVITIDFWGGNQTGGYKTRAYTQNTVAGDGRGYLVKGTDKLYLKVWCANFGPRITTNPPDPKNIYFWNGYDFNNDGDKTDWGKDGTLTGSYSEVTLGFDINGDGDATDTITVASQTANPDTFTNTTYWLGESPAFSWLADQPTLTSYEVQLSSDLNPLATGFKVALAADVEGIVSGTYMAAGTGIMFDIVAR